MDNEQISLDADGPLKLGQPAIDFQARVNDWVQSCFGSTIANDRTERTHRFLEEAIELAQSAGCTVDDAYTLVDYVFSRPRGQVVQEVGGVMTTLAAFCNAHGESMITCGEHELQRVWTKIHEIRAKQAAKPTGSPLPTGPTRMVPKVLLRELATLWRTYKGQPENVRQLTGMLDRLTDILVPKPTIREAAEAILKSIIALDLNLGVEIDDLRDALLNNRQ